MAASVRLSKAPGVTCQGFELGTKQARSGSVVEGGEGRPAIVQFISRLDLQLPALWVNDRAAASRSNTAGYRVPGCP